MPQEEKMLAPGKLWPKEGESQGRDETKDGQLLGPQFPRILQRASQAPQRPGRPVVTGQEMGRSPGREEPLWARGL